MEHLGRMGNHFRQGKRPRHPVDLKFVLEREHIPDGLEVVDVPVGSKRHLLMYTTSQLSLLGRAKRWFVDGTFKVFFNVTKVRKISNM